MLKIVLLLPVYSILLRCRRRLTYRLVNKQPKRHMKMGSTNWELTLEKAPTSDPHTILPTTLYQPEYCPSNWEKCPLYPVTLQYWAKFEPIVKFTLPHETLICRTFFRPRNTSVSNPYRKPPPNHVPIGVRFVPHA